MTSEALIAADALYSVSALCAVTAETVSFEPLQEFTAAGRSFDDELAHHSSDAWELFRRKLRRCGWDLLNAPVSLSNPVLSVSGTATELAAIAEANRASSDAATVDRARELAEMLAALGTRSDDPLGDRCREIIGLGDLERSALLVRDKLWRDAIGVAWAASGYKASAMVPQSLRFAAPLETLVVAGQARFYPQSVFDSPRAENVAVVRFAWLNDIGEVTPFLDPTRHDPIRIRRFTPPSAGAPGDYLTPAIDWASIQQPATALAGGSLADRETDQAKANLFLLAGSYAVYLETGEGSSVLVVDPEADDGGRVNRRVADSLEVGEFVILRKERRDFDFLEEIANRHLGADATRVRAAQDEWKQQLRNKVRTAGVRNVAGQLSQLGASVQNVRYWMNPESIRTRRRGDFEVLMRYLGLEAKAGTLWEMMGRIDSAHRSAGMEIRKQLLDLVKSFDIRELVAEGTVDFELAHAEAGVLSIFRVEQRSPSQVVVPRHQLRVPFPVERELWLG